MKILLTTDSFPPGGGGSAQSTASLAEALAHRSHSVIVVVGRRGVSGESERTWNDIPVVEVGLGEPRRGPGRTGRLESGLCSFLRAWAPKERFDLAHAQHLLSAGPTVEAGNASGFPVLVTVRDYWPVCIWSTHLSGDRLCPGCSYVRRVLCLGRRNSLLWPLAPFLPPLIGAELKRRRRTLSSAAAVVAVSRQVGNLLPPHRRMEVIPNFLDLAAIDRALAGPAPTGTPERFVLFVGKLEPNKAPDDVIPILQASRVELPLVVVGAGSLAGVLERQARRARREVRFLGWQAPEGVLRLMRCAEAVIFPSRWPEPLSRVLLEGLSVGAVLVAQRSGGNEEILVHGESGLLGSSLEEMAGGLARVCSESGLASRLRRGARERAVGAFSEKAVLPRMEALYCEVTGRGAGR